MPSEIPRLSTDSPVRVFPGVWKLLSFLRLPSQDRSLSLPLLSLFLSFIFFPTSFRRQWAAFLGAWCPLLAFRSCFVAFTQCSNVLLMNLLGEKVVSPSYSSAILGPTLTILSYIPYAIFQVFPVRTMFFHVMPRHIIFISWNNNQKSSPVNFSFQNQV